MIQKSQDNIELREISGEHCSACRDLLSNMSRFSEMFEPASKPAALAWLTVNDIALELKVSKSIIYRLIRHGELEAVNIVETNREIAKAITALKDQA